MLIYLLYENKHMAMSSNKQNNDNVTKNIKVEIEVMTPVIAPSLSPNKAMKRIQIEDIKKCYPQEFHELIEHLDRAFGRNAECDIILPSFIITGALRNQYPQYSNVIVSGIILVSKNFVRIGTRKVANSLMNYEYLVPGTKINTILTFNQDIKLPLLLRIGAKKNKGYGVIKITEA